MTVQLATAQIDTDKRSKPLRVTGRLKQALDLMVWSGKQYHEAAAEVGLTTRAMRLALGKPHVLAALKAEQQVLRSSMGPRNIHRLAEIREAAANMPAVNAIGMLIRMDEEQTQRGSGVSASPGVTIRILNVVAGDTRSSVEVGPDVKHINGLGHETG